MNQQPIIWIFKGDKYGDFLQMENVAKALGFNYVIKDMPLQQGTIIRKNKVKKYTYLSDIDKILTPPWPNLVLASGRHGAIAALATKEKEKNCKLVHIGRPWCDTSKFDLIITTPQYGLTKTKNIIVNPVTLNKTQKEKIDQQCLEWQNRIGIPPPYLAVLLGGDSYPFMFTIAKAQELATIVNRIAFEHKLTPLITTSRRTPSFVKEIFVKELNGNYIFHEWNANTANPYHAFLGFSKMILVTNDSASMISDACYTQEKVLCFELQKEVSLKLAFKEFVHLVYSETPNKLLTFVLNYLFLYKKITLSGTYLLRNMTFFVRNLERYNFITTINVKNYKEKIKNLPVIQNNFDDYFENTVSEVKKLLQQ